MALEKQIAVYRFQQGYAERLLEGLGADQASRPVCEGGVNPAWIVGHLGFVANNITAMLGGTPKIDIDAWKPLFGGGSQVSADPSAYPAWDDLLAAFRESHANLTAAVAAASAEQLAAPNPSDRMREALPTVEDFLSFVLTAHIGMHLGQLSTWRRAQGQPPLF